MDLQTTEWGASWYCYLAPSFMKFNFFVQNIFFTLTSLINCSGFCLERINLFFKKKASVCLANSRNFCKLNSIPAKMNKNHSIKKCQADSVEGWWLGRWLVVKREDIWRTSTKSGISKSYSINYLYPFTQEKHRVCRIFTIIIRNLKSYPKFITGNKLTCFNFIIILHIKVLLRCQAFNTILKERHNCYC